MQVRPYQQGCVDGFYACLDTYRSPLIVLATGLGKTVVGALIIAEWFARSMPGRVLWLAHREELISQAADTIRRITRFPVAVEMGASFADEDGFRPASVVLASPQTLSRPRRRRRLWPQRFGLVITDEAHHAPARGYRSIYKYFREGDKAAEIPGNPQLVHLGLTATPKRADNTAMGLVYDHTAYEYPIAPAVADGYLVPVHQATAIVEELDLSRVKVVNGDFSARALEALLTDPDRRLVVRMARPIVEQAGDKATIVFCVGKHQARLMADAINDARPHSAYAVTDETPRQLRRQITQDFRDGRLQFFVNCGIACEGFDAARVSLVAIARPTKSLNLYTQMIGRGTRPLSGTIDGILEAEARRAAIAASAKPSCTILDFVGNVERHASSVCITAVDILGGNFDPETRQLARAIAAQAGAPCDVEQALELAQAERELLGALEDYERKNRIVADVDYRLRYHEDGDGPEREHSKGRRGEPATERQVWKLVKLGVRYDTAAGYSKPQASAIIDKLVKKQEASV